MRPCSIYDNLIVQLPEAEEVNSGSKIIKPVDKHDRSRIPEHGRVISVPHELRKETKLTPMALANPVGRPEPVRKVTSAYIEKRIRGYKESLMANRHRESFYSIEQFNDMVDNFAKGILRSIKPSPTGWEAEYLGVNEWKMEVEEGMTVYFDSTNIDHENRMDWLVSQKDVYKVPYDRIVAFEKDGEVKTTAGYVLFEKIEYETEEMVVSSPSSILDMDGQRQQFIKTEKVKKVREDRAIVHTLPEHTIKNEEIGCRLGDEVLLKEAALRPIEINGKLMLRAKYREILAVVTKTKQ